MATKTVRVWDGASQSSKDTKLYTTLSSINSKINASDIPDNATITSAKLYVNAGYSGGIAPQVYLTLWIGNTSANNVSIMGRTKISSGSSYPSSGFELINYFSDKVMPVALNLSSYGSYLVAQMDTANIATPTMKINYAEIVFTYTEHTHSYTETKTPSTCITKGSVTKKCSCGDTQTTELALDPNNHTGGTELRNVSSATCTATGYTGDTHCKSCGAKISSGSTIDKLGHNYESVVTQPTENSKGYTTNTCSRCGDSYVDKYTCLVTLKTNNDYGTVAGGKTYNQGETVAITAIPKEDCMFVSWNDGVKTASRNITVLDSVIYTAYFKLNAIYVGDSQSVTVYVDDEEAEKVFVDETTSYG